MKATDVHQDQDDFLKEAFEKFGTLDFHTFDKAFHILEERSKECLTSTPLKN